MERVSLIDGHIDNGMPDENIIKALGCCTMNGLCGFCYLKSDKKGCQDRLHKDALDLINRQKAEIKRLKQKPLYDFYKEKSEAIKAKTNRLTEESKHVEMPDDYAFEIGV